MEISMAYGWQQWASGPRFLDKFYNIYATLSRLVYSWRWDYEDNRLLQLWTIPVEFSCSMLLFIVILGLSRVKSCIRMAVVVLLMAHCHYCGHWGPAEFLTGMLMAEVEEILTSKDGLNSDSVAWTSFWLFNFLCGLFLCEWPDEKADQSSVLRYVAPLTPKSMSS